METESRQLWHDWAALVIGAGLFLVPLFVSRGELIGPAAWNSYVVGAAVMIFAACALVSRRRCVEWATLVLGAWLIAAPFALGFYTGTGAAAWSQIVAGVLLAADAIWALAARPSSGGGAPALDY